MFRSQTMRFLRLKNIHPQARRLIQLPQHLHLQMVPLLHISWVLCDSGGHADSPLLLSTAHQPFSTCFYPAHLEPFWVKEGNQYKKYLGPPMVMCAPRNGKEHLPPAAPSDSSATLRSEFSHCCICTGERKTWKTHLFFF